MKAMRAARAASLIAVLLVAGGCRPASPAAASAPVAWVAHDTLDTERLGRLLVLAQPFPLETGAVVDLVRHWQLAVAMARFPERRAEAVTAAVRASAADAAVAALRVSRFGDPATEATERAAAVHARGELRLVAHVLRRADRAARAEERTVQRRAAETILRDLRTGMAWRDANRRNEDDAARTADGIIGLVARGELPAPLDSIAFALAPGAYSDVVESSAGFHIVHRPAFDRARDAFVRALAERIADEQERSLGGDVAVRRSASLAPVAAIRVREIALDPWAALSATDPVGSFDGGTLTGGALAALLASLAWDARRAVLEAPADAREAFAGRALVRAALRAEAAGSDVGAGDTAAVRTRIGAQLDSIARNLPVDASDPGLAVDRYMGRLAARHLPMVTPAAEVWQALLAGTDAAFRGEQVATAIGRARALLDAGGYTEGRP